MDTNTAMDVTESSAPAYAAFRELADGITHHMNAGTLTLEERFAVLHRLDQAVASAAAYVVAEQREAGMSWAEIGAANHVSKQTMHRRYAYLDEVLDPAVRS